MAVENFWGPQTQFPSKASAQQRMLTFFFDAAVALPTIFFIYKLIFHFSANPVASVAGAWFFWILISSTFIWKYKSTPFGLITKVKMSTIKSSFLFIVLRQVFFSLSLLGLGVFQMGLLFNSKDLPFYDRWFKVFPEVIQMESDEVAIIYNDSHFVFQNWMRAFVLSVWLILGFQIVFLNAKEPSSCNLGHLSAQEVFLKNSNGELTKTCVSEYVDERLWLSGNDDPSKKLLYRLKAQISSETLKTEYLDIACGDQSCEPQKLLRQAEAL